MGRGTILGWFRKNAPTDPVKKAEFDHTLGNLENLWNILLLIALAAGVFGLDRFVVLDQPREKDWPTARKSPRKIPPHWGLSARFGFC